jgi:ribonuclease P protein component
LLKRQIRAAVARQGLLDAGLWVIRLRAPFAREQFVSAASSALGTAARIELDSVLAAAAARKPAGV